MTDTHLQTRSFTAVVLEELKLYGWRPFTDKPDPRPLPEPDAIRTAVADIFDALVSTLSDTRLEPDLEDLLWSTTNLFHRMATRTGRDLDSNEQAQKRAQREQDGSEVRSVELETLIAEGITLIERRNAFEAMRDLAAELFETHLGQNWHPRAGSHVNRRTLTASLIDSRDHLAATRRAAPRHKNRFHWRAGLQRSFECLGGPRPHPCETRRPGLVARRRTARG